MDWQRDGNGAMIAAGWTPDLVAERNERLAWRMRNNVPFHMVGGHLLGEDKRGRRSRDSIAEDLRQAMNVGRGQWKGRSRELALSGVPVAAEGTYGALGAYPLPAELASVTPTTTEASLLTTANAAIYMPLPINGILAPQAYRFVVSGRVTTTVTAANYTWTPRLGNANTSPSLGASAAIAKTVSITNAIFMWKGDLTIQSVGAPGANSKAVGHFGMDLNTAAAGATVHWTWGSTSSASFDSTIAPGANGGMVWLGVTASAAAADPFIVGSVHFMDWN